ncbi:MAG: T9SS type A sorting domain-containing protein, partial [Candidatus Kapaibacteriota bacterium]
DGYLLLTMKNTENYPYKGNRKYSATLNLDYQVFFPERIESKYNNLTLTRNPVLNGDRREFTVSAEGDFELDGELMKIWGKPGLSDEDSTNIQIISSDYFGKSVDETYRPGNFKVINICGDRRLLDLAINEINYYPNPTYDKINIEIDSKQEQILSFNIYSSTGIFIEKISSNLIIGNNIIEVNLQNYDYGSYNIIIEGQNVFYPIKIIKSE